MAVHYVLNRMPRGVRRSRERCFLLICRWGKAPPPQGAINVAATPIGIPHYFHNLHNRPLRWEGVPDLDGFVEAARGDVLAVRRPGDGVHDVGMTTIGVGAAAIESAPDLDGFVGAGGGDEPAVGRPCDGSDVLGVSFICIDMLASYSIPHLYGIICTARGDVLAIG